MQIPAMTSGRCGARRKSEEGGQADDGVDLTPAGGVQVELVDEEKVAEQRRTRSGESEDGHGHQLEIERPDAQQPGHCRTEQHPRRAFLLGLQVHARSLEDVAALVRPLLRLAQREQGEAQRDAGERDEQPEAPIVRDGHDIAEDENPDRLRERIGEVVPAEDAPAAFGGIGIGEVRVVHRVVHARADRGGQVEEGKPPNVW
jgi:hypothetical protein